MTRARPIVILCFCVAFAAGIAAGVAYTRSRGRPPRGSRLAHELGLTPEQKEQMHQIWSGAMGSLRQKRREQRGTLRDERDKAIRDLLNEEQEAKYDAVLKAYDDKMSALSDQRRKAFDEAVDRTKRILTAPQRKKYEEMLKERAEGRRGMGPPWRGPRGTPRRPRHDRPGEPARQEVGHK